MAGLANSSHRRSNSFQKIVAAFLAQPGLPFSNVLSAERIQQVFGHHRNLFGCGGIYSTAVVVWAFLGQILCDCKEAAGQGADPNDMTDVDLIEMVCDWTAMSQEFGQDGGSARGWADKTIGSRLHLNENRRQFVYSIIEILDSHLNAPSGRGDRDG